MKYALALIFFLFQSAVFAEAANLSSFRDGTKGEILRLAGSNTIGAQLAPSWAKAYLQAKGAKNVDILALNENEYRIQGTHNGNNLYIDILAHGSSTGFKKLNNNTPSIAMSSRPIKTAELARLKQLGDLTKYSAEHVIAIDGLAIIVHPNNPITTLSVTQLGQIFSGQVSNWKEVGGKDRAIKVLARDDKSGTWDTFKSLVLQKQFALSNDASRFESNDALSQQVSQLQGAIGFVGLSSVLSAKAIAVIDGGTDALRPEPLFVATEDYPLSRRLYLYTPETPKSSVVREFIRFAQQAVGQDIVENIGFVSQNPKGLKVAHEGGSAFYKALTQHAQRLSMNFRFQPGRSELDNKAKRDVMRLAEFLKKPENKDLRIQLIGFSDQERKQSLAEVLSKLRASAVKRELFRHGVTTESVEGFGAERPVASASAKNDRVEVWIYAPDKSLAIDKIKLDKILQDEA